MLKFIYDRALIIGMSLSFFTFGFVLAKDVYDLTSEEVTIGLIAGAVCGVTVFLIEIANFMRINNADRGVPVSNAG